MLLKYAWTDDACFPGQQKLAEDIGPGERSVRTYLKELEDAKFLEVAANSHLRISKKWSLRAWALKRRHPLPEGILAKHREERLISLLGISVSNLERCPVNQLELSFACEDEKRRPGSRQGMARRVADGRIDKIRDRFGWKTVGYGSLALGVSRSVPDEFRQLERILHRQRGIPQFTPHTACDRARSREAC
jgi:hypothetical protein